MDTGIPNGLRISIGGNMKIVSHNGGSLAIEFETFRMRKGESFLVLVDDVEVLNVDAGT